VEVPKQAEKKQIALCLVSLNYRAKELKLKWLECEDFEEKDRLHEQIRELYNLKSAVITKLLSQGFAKVCERVEYPWGTYYLIGICDCTFHCPETPELLEAAQKL
jgi:hypothetical protein